MARAVWLPVDQVADTGSKKAWLKASRTCPASAS
jgi:hypothetical protein